MSTKKNVEMSGKKTKSERPPKEKLTTTDSGGPKVVTNFKEQVCYRCKQPGHTAAECLSKFVFEFFFFFSLIQRVFFF